jgi:flagellar biosynthetic protein FliO
MQMLLALGATIGLIIACAMAVRKLNGSKFGGSQQALSIVSTTAFSGKERVVLLKVRGRELLLGVTANSVSLLQDFPDTAETLPETTNV